MLEPAYVPGSEIDDLVRRQRLADTHGPVIVAVDDDRPPQEHLDLGSEPCVVVGRDVRASDAELDLILRNVAVAPIAATTTCVLLRATKAMRSHPHAIQARLALESVTYSTLQAGPEFASWRATRPPRTAPQSPNPIALDRNLRSLTITLNRPAHGNAIDRNLRDELCDALEWALLDRTVERVDIVGAGRHFCTGGDLDEFGTFPSPAQAHVYRLQRSPARLLSALCISSVHVQVHVHGNSAGSGIELASFGNCVTADPDSTFWLPELSLGLVPGAGGTVSIVDRIGAERTAYLLLTGIRIDAPTAARWGLIDEIVGRP